ncbi:hypothetical protein ISU10_12100 [Nocardioides agariphilus]|uniref:Uncharacterized protein n=1 Tax=Nocardioides agariphilus TaxID=433664 RepID=A0A930YIS7_9ACTN|nr:hypothetical protein [Nocardioides agariphilus]MBF4768507.1 hypothetical protein [Nocardioides agariphilus]
MRRLVLVGAVGGLAWAAGLRGWMIQMAASEGSTFHWYGTFALVLLPGTVVGGLFGLADHRRRAGMPRSGWLAASPLLFGSALLDPTILRQLVEEGIGGGALGVATAGIAGGYALSGRGRPWGRRACGALATLLVLGMLVMASDQYPLGEAHGLWVGTYAASLVALLCLASAIPQRGERRVLVPRAWHAAAIGGLAGYAWAASLRAFMWEVAGEEAGVDAVGTFVWVLLPGTVIGALLALAEWRRWRGGVRHRRWLVWSPMLFAAILVSSPQILLNPDGGIGLAAVAVPAMCMLGGYAIAGRGPVAVRVVCAVVALSAIPAWALTAEAVGGPSMGLDDPHGAWAAVLYWALLAVFMIAAAVPHRHPAQSSPPVSPGSSSESPSITTTA